MSEPLRLLFMSDGHLEYSARCRTHVGTGLNMRERDGYHAWKQTVDLAFEHEVDMVLHGGDLFHKSHPSIMAITKARKELHRLSKAGIPFFGNTGNHDATNERSKAPATAAVHDPDRGITMVTDPYQVIRPVDGLAIHVISHYGLAQAERILPVPVDGAVNILTAHGAAMVPGHELFHCVDSPGEQPLGLDLLTDDRFAMTVLGHYHGMDEILPNVWYAGSSLRRGFSDPPGGRGALLLTISADGKVEVERLFIDQRPQFDLPAINAAGMTGAEVEEAIRLHIADVDFPDAMVRQVVTNCSTSIRRGIDQPALSKMMERALVWQPDFRRPDVTDAAGDRTVEGVSSSLTTAGAADLPGMYRGWIVDWTASAQIAESIRPVVIAEGERHLRASSANTEAGDYAAPGTGTSLMPPQRAEARPPAIVPAVPVVEYASTDEEPPF